MKSELSIIIPALNEEKTLPFLLKDIRQNKKKYEVIIIDNGSKDKTAIIARNYGYKTIVLNQQGISKARNYGAKKASGKYLLFLDADIRLKKDFINKALNEFRIKKIDIANFKVASNKFNMQDKFIWKGINAILKLMQYLYPLGNGGSGILIKKKIHKKIGGFDERLINF